MPANLATAAPSPNAPAPGLPAGAVSRADPQDAVFATVAELFSVLATPVRLKIISSLCHQEKNVSQLLAEIDTTQPNMSQHLSTLYRAGVLGRRREGTQVWYRLENERVATLCRAVCTQVAIELGGGGADGTRLLPPAARGRLAGRPARR